jgi:hypothetical protein
VWQKGAGTYPFCLKNAVNVVTLFLEGRAGKTLGWYAKGVNP